MKQVFFAVLICCVIAFGAAVHVDLNAKYPFSAVLLDDENGYYALYWNFTRSTESIYFAVNVSTTGWVGFGLSPDGQMTGSDVVIGWVAGDGTGYFHDRYATGRSLPPIDSKTQDWFLLNSEEENGFTLLEFSRNFTSCDPQDLDVPTSTARVVWSFGPSDPTDSMGSDAAYHGRPTRGARSLNLRGGLAAVNRVAAQDQPSLNFTVQNVVIPPVPTTYWCESFRLPEQLSTVHYIDKFAPLITPHAHAFVHHIIIYQCPGPLPEEAVGVSMPCDDLAESNVTAPVFQCTQGLVIGGWAVGGEEFVFPEGVAYPIGGPEQGDQQFAVLEMHYDNPDRIPDVVDSSGMRFFYTTEEPVHQAGLLSFGHAVTEFMIVPPQQRNFTITGSCFADCTVQGIPDSGIRVFANSFHTHLAGHGLTIEHYRMNEECGVLEELEPIEQNLNYDFNFQQYNHLPREHVILPGDILTLKCFYSTIGRENLTLGGLGTREEMCLTFAYYYPKPLGSRSLDGCITYPAETSFDGFIADLIEVDPASAIRLGSENFTTVLNDVDWVRNPGLVTSLRDSVANSPSGELCVAGNSFTGVTFNKEVQPVCSYIAPDKCSDEQPLSCCERIAEPASGAQVKASLLLLLMTIAVNLL